MPFQSIKMQKGLKSCNSRLILRAYFYRKLRGDFRITARLFYYFTRPCLLLELHHLFKLAAEGTLEGKIAFIELRESGI